VHVVHAHTGDSLPSTSRMGCPASRASNRARVGRSINQDGALVLVAARADVELAERVVARSDGHLDMSDVRYGTMSFVA
jgi:hypothetical protein